VVFGVSAVMGRLNATSVVPEPSAVPLLVGVRVPKLSLHTPGFVVAYRNQAVALEPFGSAEPFSVAVVDVSNVCAVVVTVGDASVVNDRTEPKAVPSAFEAIAQK
jgi:hypothetical protein